MSAVVYRDRESGFYRAVCKDEKCRSGNAQRNYWRSPHMQRRSCEVMAREHDREHHAQDVAQRASRKVEHALRRRPASGFDVDGRPVGDLS